MDRKELNEKRGKLLAEAEAMKTDLSTDEKRNAFSAKLAEIEGIDDLVKNEDRFDSLKKQPSFDVPKDEQKRSYNIQNVIASMCGIGKADIGYEREYSQEIAHRSGMTAEGIFVPFEQRTNSTTNAGGMVATQIVENLPYLYPSTVLDLMGAKVLTGLSGNLQWNQQTTSAKPAAKGETATADSKDMVFTALNAQPHRVPVTADISKQLILQTNGSAQSFIEQELRNGMAAKIEDLVFSGSGSAAEPLGILNVTGIQSVTNANNTFTYANAQTAKSKLLKYRNGGFTPGWIGAADVYGFLSAKSIDTGSGRFVWNDETGTISGYKAEVGDAISNGNLLLADWSRILLQYWGGLDLVVDPYTKAKDGQIVVTVTNFFDVSCLCPSMIIKNANAISA